MSVLINALQAMPLPYEGLGEYLLRTTASEEEFSAFGGIMAEFGQLDSEGAYLKAFDQEAFDAALTLKTAHEITKRTKSAPPQSMWSAIAAATKVLLRKTQDETWTKKYRTMAAWGTV